MRIATSLTIIVLAALAAWADPPSADSNTSCGGSCQAICVNGCDTGTSYSWQQARCSANALADTFGPYCGDGYNCDFGACGRASERACNTAGTACTGCANGYQYSAESAVCVPQFASPGLHLNWMRDLYSFIKDKPFNQIALPGTHDSGTSTMGGFARTQNRGIVDQLNGGIRAFDLRPCDISGIGICHGIDMTGPRMQDVLNNLRNWLSTHPLEIVYLNMQGCGEADATAMGQTSFNTLSSMISTTLAGYLPDHMRIDPTSTVTNIQSKGGGDSKGTVVVNFSPGTACSSYLSAASATYWLNKGDGSWANTTTRTTMKSTLSSKLSSRNLGKMFTLQTEATPNSPLLWTPFRLAERSNPVVQRWIRDEWRNMSHNIIQADYYENTCLVPLVKWLNSGKTGSIPGCYSWPTANQTAWDEKVWNF